MQDRISASGKDGYVKLTVIDAATGLYKLERADNPTQAGTPLNKETLLSDDAAMAVATATNETVDTPSEAIQALAENTHLVQPLENGGTGQDFSSMPQIRVNLGSSSFSDLFQSTVSPGVDGTLSPIHLPIAKSTSDKRGTVYIGNGLEIANDGQLSILLQNRSCIWTDQNDQIYASTAIQVGNLLFVWVGRANAYTYIISGISSANILSNGIWSNGGYWKYEGEAQHTTRIGAGNIELVLDNSIHGYMQYAPIVLKVT